MSRVLVVDDDESMQRSLRLLLETYGHEVHTAGSSAEAMELFSRMHPEVLLCDLMLPDEPGSRLVERLTVGGAFPRSAVLMLTGFAPGGHDDPHYPEAVAVLVKGAASNGEIVEAVAKAGRAGRSVRIAITEKTARPKTRPH